MISIITITFNNYEELVETLDSIKNIEEIESIVINGGNCEKTKNFLKSYPGVSISEKDSGISDAFNKGLYLARGESVMFLNSGDVLLDKGYLDWANSQLGAQGGIDFVYSDIYIKDPYFGLRKINSKNADKRSLAKGLPYPHQTLIIKKKIFERVGNFNLSLKCSMDFDLILRMRKINCIGRYYSGATVAMDGTGVSSKNDLVVLKENFKVLAFHKMLTAPIIFRILISLILIGVKKTFFVQILKRYKYNVKY